jgi:hypothetical protein
LASHAATSAVLLLLAAEEGKNADAVNLAVIDRVWNLWKQRVQPTLK